MLHNENRHNNSNTPTSAGLSGALSSSIPTQLSLSSVVNEIKDKFKNDDEENSLPFQGLDKAAVLQETKIFSDANMVTRQPRKYCQLITKLLHILTHDEPFTSTETTEVFFGVTKLFQSKDSNLRRMVYLFIKEVAEATSADEVIIVTQSLTKDMNSDIDLYRANSIRVLCRIIDGAMLSAIERYIKQAIVDKNPFVASSALVAGLHLMRNNGDIIRRWVNEVQEAMNSTNDMVQYHAIMLYYSIRQIDKLAISKFVMQLQKQTLRSPLAYCLVIRYTVRLLAEDMMSPNSRTFYLYLESMLRHKNEIVIYEAAKAICSLPIDAADLSPAISVLQLFLSSPKPVLRFCASRCLNQVAQVQPLVVTKCNEDMESLISDTNRSTATLAITTLLKTGSESSIERLMKQITTFMSEIADEFKIIVVDAIRNLCLKYPSKYRVLYNFLANFLREEGGFELKRSITDSILFLIERIPESQDNGLLHLCEFIEDCEFTQLSVKILHVLGEKGVLTASPGRFIRFIYNRVILENAIIRSSAISALASYAIAIESLRPSVITLLRRCLYDDDDEVRDRATLYLAIVESHHAGETLLNKPPRHAHEILKSLECYQAAQSEGPLTFDTLPYVEIREEAKKPKALKASDNMMDIADSPSIPNIEETTEDPTIELYKIPEIVKLGQLFRSARQVNLTEEETEYVVKCTKHIFANHVVLQFAVLNTVKEQMLKNVSLQVDLNNDPAYNVEFFIPAEKIVYGKVQNCYVCLRRNPEAGFPVSKLLNELKFEVFELDSTGEPEDEGFDETYPLEPLEISCADYVARYPISDFRAAWEQLNEIPEVREQYALQYKNVVEGVSGVIANLGLTPCENTGTVSGGINARAHIMLLSGAFLGGTKILVKAKVAVDPSSTTLILQMAVRSQNQAISQIIADSIR